MRNVYRVRDRSGSAGRAGRTAARRTGPRGIEQVRRQQILDAGAVGIERAVVLHRDLIIGGLIAFEKLPAAGAIVDLDEQIDARRRRADRRVVDCTVVARVDLETVAMLITCAAASLATFTVTVIGE